MKKIIVYTFSGIIFTGFLVFSTNFFIQTKMNQSLKTLEEFVYTFISFIQPNHPNELVFSYRNTYFHIFQGFKIHKIKVEFKNTKDFCKIENLFVHLKITTLFTTFQPKSISINNLDCELNEQSNLYQILNQIFMYLQQNNFNVYIKGISINHSLRSYEGIILNFIPENDKIKIEGKWRNQDQYIHISGRWYPNHEINRIHFEFINLTQNFSFDHKIESYRLHPFFKVFNLKAHYVLNGKGSIDITPLGFANNFYGKIDKIQIKAEFLHTKNLSGEFQYSYIKAFHKEYLKEYFDFKNPINQIKLEYEKDDYNYTGKIHLKVYVDNDSIKTNFNSKGGFEFGLDLQNKNKNVLISGNLNIEKFIFLQKKSLPYIFIKKAIITTTSPNNFDYFIYGTMNSLDFHYIGNMNFHSKGNPYWKIKGNFDLIETNYQILWDMLYDFYQYARLEAKKKDAKKYQDLGPAWENKFFESELYRNFIKNINIETKLHFLNPKPNNLPSLKGIFQMNEQRLSLHLDGEHKNSWFRTQYMIDFLQIIPLHNFYVSTSLEKPELELSFFCNHCKDHMNRLFFEYSSTSNGLYYKDIYLNNTSNLKFEIDAIFVNNDYRIEFVEKLIDIDLKNKLSKLKVHYTSSGIIYNPVGIELDTAEYYLRGSGSFSLVEGGSIKCYFQNKQERIIRDFSFIIRKDGVWIPSYLY